MELLSWLKKLTTGRIVFETTSPINGKIQVVEDVFGKRLVVEGLTQSGGQVERIWKKAIGGIRNQESGISDVLILGLGAGTLAWFVSQKWPRAKITGVEIDPKIVEIGKKYFALDKIHNLEIIVSDAADFVSDYTLYPNPYTLVFVDTYLADQVPSQCETVNFLTHLKKLLAPNGLVVFNRLYYKEHRQKTEMFLDKLEKMFNTIERKKVGSNLLLFAES